MTTAKHLAVLAIFLLTALPAVVSGHPADAGTGSFQHAAEHWALWAGATGVAGVLLSAVTVGVQRSVRRGVSWIGRSS